MAARRRTHKAAEPELVGVPAADPPDVERVWKRAVEDWSTVSRWAEKRAAQSLTFSHGPVCLVEMADLHLGDDGVDYPRIEDEARIVADTPGMWLVLAGDCVNNFIIGKLKAVRFDSKMTIPNEWALLRRVLEIVARKLVVVVGGNHDHWAKMLSGVDYFRDVVAEIRPDVIYDSDDCRVQVRVGDWAFWMRVRHQWRGSSIYNPTHGIERAAKWDQDFTLGMGAHTHVSGVARSMNVGGISGMALMAGTYKRVDRYAIRGGFAKPNTSTAVAVVVDESLRSFVGFDDLKTAAAYMRRVYG